MSYKVKGIITSIGQKKVLDNGAVVLDYVIKNTSENGYETLYSFDIYKAKEYAQHLDKFLEFNSTTAELSQGTYNMFNSTRPTSTVFSIGTHNNTNGSGNSYVAYCFAEKTGYSKFGSYIGNGTNDGTFVYTGFKPVFLLIKNKGTTENWNIWDNKRDTYNAVESRLYPNTTGTESTSDSNDFDFLSNGFKVRNNGGNQGASGNTYIYMAFGQSLVGSNNIPCTAR